MVYLLPQYKTKLIKTTVLEKKVRVWNKCGTERFSDCMETTDWQVFIDSCDNVNELCEHVSEYITFCENNCFEEKTIKIFGNNKPWVTKDMKTLLIEKKRFFNAKNKEQCKNTHNKIKNKIKECKQAYKEKIEGKFNSNDTKGMWSGVKQMIGFNDKVTKISVDKGKEQEYCDNLNLFYSRFDTLDFSKDIENIRNNLAVNNDIILQMENCDVVKLFKSLKSNKACGPDNIKPKILKMFAHELSEIFKHIFNFSLKLNTIPVTWKTSKIIPVPKNKYAKAMNDFRPVALTSVLMKCLEKFVLSSFLPKCELYLDPNQYAYQKRKGVEDAILYFTDNIYKHLETPKAYARTLFLDFSSAFNTIQPHLLIPKLLNIGINKNVCLWILDFLTQRPQFVFLKCENNSFSSNLSILNTGAPQGTVLSPILFTIYTNDYKADFYNIPIIKYADDTIIQALIKSSEDLTNYRNEIVKFTNWCNSHCLQLNVKKTKEMIFDFRKKDNVHEPIIISNETVERVSEYKYLGVLFDEKLKWESQASKVSSKMNQRLYFMRKLNSYKIDNTIISLFYQSCILSILTFCLPAWTGNALEKEKQKLNRILKSACKMISKTPPDTFDSLGVNLSVKKLNSIIKDKKHQINTQIQFSTKSGRIIHPKSRTVRYLNSFIPLAIRNSDQNRVNAFGLSLPCFGGI